MSRKLLIKIPIIREDNNMFRLVSKLILPNGKNYEMYFEVEKEYSKYLCDDKCDSFLVSLIPFLVKHEYDVKVEGKISSKLYYQLTTYLIPMLCKKFKKKEIKIYSELTNVVYNSKGVGASVSCGVDSFYTLLKHKNQQDEKYNITHLTFFNAGSHGQYGGEKARKLYFDRLVNIRNFCKENNYKLVTVDTNMNELIMMDHEKTHTFRTLGCVFALEKLFGKYYFASGLEFDGSHIDEFDTACYDILNVHCLSNENISFYCSGLETSRMEKVNYISDFSETYNWLNVCVGTSSNNCSKCQKCIRTMTALESIGKLENYKNVFDLNYFNKNKNKIYGKIMSIGNDKINKELYHEILDSYKFNNIKLTKTSYLYAIMPTKQMIANMAKKMLPKKMVQKIQKKKNPNRVNDGWTD